MSAPRRSANVAMMRVIGLDSRGVSSTAAVGMQIARCICDHELEFPSGEFGQTLERCTNRSCPNHEAHTPGSTAKLMPPPPEPPKKRKKHVNPNRRRRNRSRKAS